MVDVMDPNGVSGWLMCSGAVVGLVGTTPNFFLFPFALLGYTSFLIVLVFGAVILRKRPRGRRLGAASLGFASLGGMASAALVWFGSRSSFINLESTVLLGGVGLIGTGLAATGAMIKCLDAGE